MGCRAGQEEGGRGVNGNAEEEAEFDFNFGLTGTRVGGKGNGEDGAAFLTSILNLLN